MLFLGVKEYEFPRREKYPVFYHKENSSAIYIGGEGKLYYYDFATYENYTEDFPVKNEGQCMMPGSLVGPTCGGTAHATAGWVRVEDLG